TNIFRRVRDDDDGYIVQARKALKGPDATADVVRDQFVAAACMLYLVPRINHKYANAITKHRVGRLVDDPIQIEIHILSAGRIGIDETEIFINETISFQSQLASDTAQLVAQVWHGRHLWREQYRSPAVQQRQVTKKIEDPRTLTVARDPSD